MTACDWTRFRNWFEDLFPTYYRKTLLHTLLQPLRRGRFAEAPPPPTGPPRPQNRLRPLTPAPGCDAAPCARPAGARNPPRPAAEVGKIPKVVKNPGFLRLLSRYAAPPAPSATPPSAGGRAEVWSKNVG